MSLKLSNDILAKGRGVFLVLFFYLLFNSPVTFALLDEEKFFAEDYYIKRGPSGIRNNMPLYLIYLAMPPERAQVLERHRFSVGFDYTVSNTTASAFTPVTEYYKVDIDAEVSRFALKFQYGIYDNLEIETEIPYVRLSEGYMDSFIQDFEQTFGFTTPRSRQRQGKNNYSYSLRYNSVFLINTKTPTDGLGDIPLTLKYQLMEEGGLKPNLSLRGAVKFPTADKDKLLGSGEFDAGLGLLLDKKLNRRLSGYFNFDYIFIRKPEFLSSLDMDHFILSTAGGFEFSFTRKFSTAVQLLFHTTPYPNSQTNVLDETALNLTLGFRYQLTKKIRWYGEIDENNTAASPDFSARTGIGIDF